MSKLHEEIIADLERQLAEARRELATALARVSMWTDNATSHKAESDRLKTQLAARAAAIGEAVGLLYTLCTERHVSGVGYGMVRTAIMALAGNARTPPAPSPRMMKGNRGPGVTGLHASEHMETEACNGYPACEPVENTAPSAPEQTAPEVCRWRLVPHGPVKWGTECGANYQEDHKVCPSCGKPVVVEAKKRRMG